MSNIQQMYGLRQVEGYKVTGLAGIKTDNVVKSTEFIGIEVEVENYRERGVSLNRVWSTVNDGSLRNNGVEFITRPIPASAAPVALEFLFNHFLSDECCFSPRTSVHIHLNVQDLTPAQVTDLVMIYTIFEKQLYQFAGRGRMKNIYCVPLSDNPKFLTRLSSDFEANRARWQKYTGLNLLPISDHGTVEFRHMHGSRDVAKLTKWINLIVSLKEYMKANSTEAIRKMVYSMNDSYDFTGLMKAVFGEYSQYLEFSGDPAELNYLGAKLAMTPPHSIRAARTAALVNFKG